ncbi:MAG: hypothetical protein AB1756_03920 [Acidobacteriota bacterium]
MENKIIRPIFLKHNYYPEIIHLNPQFNPKIKLLRATILIDWKEDQKRKKIERLITKMAEISSTIHMHRCSDDGVYLPFAKQGKKKKKKSFDGDVALAHLIEHLTIDFLCFVTELRKCSGVTCAFRRPRNKFDLFIESIEVLPCIFSFSLAVSAVDALLQNGCPAEYFKNILKASRYCYMRRYDLIEPLDMAAFFNWGIIKTEEILEIISMAGFVEKEEYSFNFSGVSKYRLSRQHGYVYRPIPAI